MTVIETLQLHRQATARLQHRITDKETDEEEMEAGQIAGYCEVVLSCWIPTAQ